MGRRALPEGEGMLLVPGGSIHMFFMRFAVDAVFLDADGGVRRIVAGLRPWRVARAPRGTRFTLELAAGQAAAHGLAEGSQLELAGGGWTSLGRRRRLL